ncbi:MAG: EAL domain-containing protein [Acidimicrobiales bacterium]
MDTAETGNTGAPTGEFAPDKTGRLNLNAGPPRSFAIAAGVGAALLVLFALWMAHLSIDHGSPAGAELLVKLLAAALAAASCAVASRRAEPASRLAWAWIAAATGCWALGEVALTCYEFLGNGTQPFPSIADAGFLVALPLVTIGLLLFPSMPKPGVSAARVVLDGVIVAGSLLVVSWTTALGAVYHARSAGFVSQAVGLAYPISYVIVATVAISILAQEQGRPRRPRVLVIAGLLCLTVFGSAIDYLSHVPSFGYPAVLAAGVVAGLLLIGLAPLWPLDRRDDAGEETAAASAWRVLLPYLFVGAAIMAAVIKSTESHHVGLFVVTAGLCVVAALFTRQVLTLVENQRLTNKMRYAVDMLRADQLELVHFALHDSLTGLPNRVLFGDRIDHALARRSSPTRRIAVMLCDLDSFKDVNDTLGHASGDEVLIATSDRLSSCVRPADTVARIGGDEFAILIDDASGVDEVAAVAARVCSTLRTPILIGGRDFAVKGSIGIALANRDDIDGEKLLQDADVALYASKDAGGDDYTFFEPRLGKAYVDRLGLQGELSRAIGNDELFMDYQPVVELASGRTVGVEALLRWRHPRRGVMKPVDFLPVAETSGLVVEVGAWAISEALRQLRAWRDEMPAAAGIWAAVNVSARQLASGDLAGEVSRAIKASGLEPESLHIDLTESAAIDLVDWSSLVLGDLKDLGVRLNVDNFGSGYSSFTYLKQLPIDGVKIDKAFVNGLGADGRDAVIVETVVSLAHALRLKVAAEGVETNRQVAWLRTLGCDFGQGYQWSPPVSAADLGTWLGRG